MRTVALVAFMVAVFILFTGGDAYTINRKRRLSLDEGELWNTGMFEEYIGNTHEKKRHQRNIFTLKKMRTTLVISFMIFTCTSALVINKNQGEGSIQFKRVNRSLDHEFASGQEKRGTQEPSSVQEQLKARAIGGDIPVGQCERSTKKCVPRG
ncbi:hypothetical protein EDC94DRAFT_647850 [Helicostylum pulchrum]|nr:hypothetical protein EDC94DRAFT_647850 [Helicostylum pulchrum]